jgi:hypothetical protein
MLEHIIYGIVRSILAGNEPDKEALEMYLGSYDMADEIISGITRAINDNADDDKYAALRGYE